MRNRDLADILIPIKSKVSDSDNLKDERNSTDSDRRKLCYTIEGK